jgi:hypothetical protein
MAPGRIHAVAHSQQAEIGIVDRAGEVLDRADGVLGFTDHPVGSQGSSESGVILTS